MAHPEDAMVASPVSHSFSSYGSKSKALHAKKLRAARAVETVLDLCRRRLHIRNKLVVNFMSELYATCILLFIGIGVVCQFDLAHKTMNTWIHINVGWGFAIAFAVYTASRCSGGHLNPAISLMFWTFGEIPFINVIAYSIAQTLGAFIGTALAYTVYYEQIIHVIGYHKIAVGANATATLFTSMAPAHVSNYTAFWDQFVGTGFLALFVTVIVDNRMGIPHGMRPLLVGFVVMMIGMAFGMNVGYPINPARDFAPRLFAYLIGYGSEIFTDHDNYWWVPVVAPFPGAVIAPWTFYMFVGFHVDEPAPRHLEKVDENENSPSERAPPSNKEGSARESPAPPSKSDKSLR